VFLLLAIFYQNLFNTQYAISLSGMILGNAMTELNLGLKTFHENMESERLQIETLLNFGVKPKQILLPFVNKALET
jgi:putative ABC transport system permease protein